MQTFLLQACILPKADFDVWPLKCDIVSHLVRPTKVSELINFLTILGLKVTLYYNNADEFKHIANVAEVLAYLLLIPMLIFLGKRNSLFACFCLLSTSAMIGIILPGESLLQLKIFTTVNDFLENTQIVYNIFAVLLGQTGLCFCWFLFLDLFPTFSRATVMGIGICTYNIASAITIVTVNLIDVRI